MLVIFTLGDLVFVARCFLLPAAALRSDCGKVWTGIVVVVDISAAQACGDVLLGRGSRVGRRISSEALRRVVFLLVQPITP
jgi:hypothetical protein